MPIADTDNVGIVHDKLMMLGGRLVTETVDAILADTVKSVPQEEMAVVANCARLPKYSRILVASTGTSLSSGFMILSVVCLPIRLRGQNWYSPTEQRWF